MPSTSTRTIATSFPVRRLTREIQCTAGADLGQGEYIIHKHDSFCFDDSGELLCALAEQDEHVHTDACYDGDTLICGLVTGIVHQHTADCVISVPATEPQGLVCTMEEHKHTEACFMNPEGEASNGDTPEDSAAVNSTPARAPAASGPITDVTLTINDNVSTSGCYEAAVGGGAAALEEKNVQYLWYKSTDDGANYTAVTAKNFLLLAAKPCLTSVGTMAKSCSWPWTAELSATRCPP